MIQKKSKMEKYPSCNLQIHIDKDSPFTANDELAFKEVAKRLELSGGSMIRIGNIIDISFERDSFVKVHNRNCGQKEKAVTDNNDDSVTFADIVYWHYGLKETWTEIAEHLNISRATLIRRKKKYEQLSYYNHYMNAFDRAKADDLEYLKSLQYGDALFI